MRTAVCACLIVMVSAAAADSAGESIAFTDEFDAATPSWGLDSPTAIGQIVRQERLLNPTAADGASVERLVIVCPPGESMRIAQAIGAAPVIDESRIAIRVRTNRPGLQIAARVVLPRTGSGTQPPQTLVVRGSRDEAPGGWRELEIRDLPILVTRQARVLRTGSDIPIDERGAYIDRVILIVPGGAGASEVLIDRLIVKGIANETRPIGDSASTVDGPEFPTNHPSGPSRPSPVHSVRFSGTQIAVNDRPFFPRIVQYNGEELEFLARCGFNTVWMRETPSTEQLLAAQKLGIALVVPPPKEQILAEEAASWNPVMAWDLGERLAATQLDTVTAQAQTLRREDQILQRPLVLAPTDSLARFSRVADILLVGRRASLHDLKLENWKKDLHLVGQATRPGTPLWVRLDLDPSPELIRQVRILAPHAAKPWQSPWRISSQARSAIDSGARGLVFASQQSLMTSDTNNRLMLAGCELLNRELILIEPWLVEGITTGSATCTDPTREAVVMQRKRVRLVAVRRLASATSIERAKPSTESHVIVVPGVLESAGAYLLTPGGLKSLALHRVSGGVRIPLDGVPAGAYILLTDDAVAVTEITRGVARGGARAAQIARFLAVEELRLAEQIGAQLGQMPEAQQAAQRSTATVKAEIAQADLAMAARNYEAAYRHLLAARDRLALLEAQLLERPATEPALASSPLDGSFPRLIDQWKLQWALKSLPHGDNLLFAGDCEELSQMMTNGWTHTRYPVPGVESAVELTADQPQQGTRSLRMQAQRSNASAAEPEHDLAAVWIASPEVSITPGQTVEIAGWVWVPPRQSCGLTITDSLGGEELALNANPAPSWQPFRMIRTAADSSTVQVEFALYGCGEARIDGVMIRPVLPGPTARQLPAGELPGLQIAK